MSWPPEVGPPQLPSWRKESTVYIVGVDGCTLNVVRPLAAEGELPNFTRLATEGCHGPLATISPNQSSLLWTTIATGRHYHAHGIDASNYYQVFGMRLRRTFVRRWRMFGLRLLLRALQARGLAKMRSFDQRDVKVKALWDIMSEGGGRVGVVNWPTTWPACQVNGFMVSDRLQFWRMIALEGESPTEQYLTFPRELLEQLGPSILRPEEVSADHLRRYVNLPEDELRKLTALELQKRDIRSELRYVISSNHTTWNVFEHCLGAFPRPNLAMLLFYAMDKVQHAGLRYTRFSRDPSVTQEEREKFGEIVPQAYRFIDEVIGKILARMGPDDTLFVVSDHGFAYEPKRGTYGHKQVLPPGVFYAYGKQFRAGQRVEGATIYDVMPTVLRLCGLPASRQMRGRCLEEILTPQFRREHPPLLPLPSYGPLIRRFPEGSELHLGNKGSNHG